MAGKRLGSVLVACVLATAGCTGNDDGEHFTPVSAPRVGITIGKPAEQLKIGVIYTGLTGFVGRDVYGLAAGATVAAFRINKGSGARVTLTAVDDSGSTSGSKAAVDKLVRAGVSGIVYASVGDQITAGLAEARRHQIAVALPYASRPAGSGDSVWATGPTDAQSVSAIGSQLTARKLGRPLVVTTGQAPAGLSSLGTTVRLTAGPDLAADVAQRAAGVGDPGHPQAVVIWAKAADAADIVGGLQQANVSAPALLGPTVLSPSFGNELQRLATTGGLATTSGNFETVGEQVTDFSTSRNAAAFLAAVRATGSDPRQRSLNGVDSFAEDGVSTADTRSHDAVIALATAAARASGTGAQGVLIELRHTTLDEHNGLAGASLDFRHSDAVDAKSVVGLQAGTQSSGQRGSAAEAAPVTWFANTHDAG